MMPARMERIRRDLAHERESELQLWLATGAQAAADPTLPSFLREAAAEQVVVCRDLLARQARRDGALPLPLADACGENGASA